MNAPWILAASTPIALGAAWLLYQLADFESKSLRVVHVTRRWAARVLLLIGLLCPPAATAAFLWIVKQEQDRIMVIVDPMLEHLRPTTTPAP
ncbi:hypothetical protein [Ilumatobacter coccineus]|nr:hypothetical protein [Ilumatobacter coccineus]